MAESCCVLTLPLLTEPWQEHILETRFRIMEHLQNSLIAMELRKLKNLERTKKYRDLYRKIADTPDAQRKPLYKLRTQMLRDAGFSEFKFIDDMTPMQKHFVPHIAAQVAHKTATDVWRAFEKLLFGTGQAVHFKKRGTLSSVANKKAGNGMNYKNGMFIWSGGQCREQIVLKIPVQNPETNYEREMLERKIKYFRVLRKWSKSRYKYYLQFTLAGEPVQKERPIGNGRVGIDMGTQTIAVASDSGVMLRELADRANPNHEKLHAIQLRMDRSRRAVNPENYNPDGTIRRGVRLTWRESNRYKALAAQARELQRKNADIRKYQHTCLANEILAMGTEIYVEPMNYHALQLRAKETTVDEKGRFRRKKRFGKSLANKAPATFLLILDQKLKTLGLPSANRVDGWEYRASQYDHLNGAYNRKKLSQRTHHLSNGDNLQRDLYSAFLLMNADATLKHPDTILCSQTYERFKKFHDREVQRIQDSGGGRLSSFGIA